MYKQSVFPAYRGFNLSYLIVPLNVPDKTKGQHKYREELLAQNPMSNNLLCHDLELIYDLGFNFVRFPLNYYNLIDNYNDFWQGKDIKFNESYMAIIDNAIEKASELGIYVEFALHNAPGYTVGGYDLDPYKLWIDDEATKPFIKIWQTITKRYSNISENKMGFNLVNEPYSQHKGSYILDIENHNKVMRETVDAIRKLSDNRTIFIDGTNWGRDAIPELCHMKNVVQSLRAYDPAELTHYPMRNGGKVIPVWPGMPGVDCHNYEEEIMWDRNQLYKEFEVWAKMAQENNVGIHCGEGGVLSPCPFDVAYAWFKDVMEILTHFNIGFAMWELRGKFGIADSNRDCEKFEHKGHLIDKPMLDLMKT